MAEYVLSRKAIYDLEEIWQYSCTTWSETQADKYYELLTGAFKTISRHPGLGKSYEEISTDLSGLRVGQHIIFYRTTKLKTIEVIRILHVRMDVSRQL